MKKNDLKNGMIVECRNGNQYIVIKEFEIYGYTYDGVFWPYLDANPYALSNNFGEYTDNLLVADSIGDGYDIMKIYHRDFISSDDLILLWERKEIKLTKDEKVILKNLPKEYEWIARDSSNIICIHAEKPIKEFGIWECNTRKNSLDIFKHLFKFIKWEDKEPYNIEKLLKEN